MTNTRSTQQAPTLLADSLTSAQPTGPDLATLLAQHGASANDPARAVEVLWDEVELLRSYVATDSQIAASYASQFRALRGRVGSFLTELKTAGKAELEGAWVEQGLHDALRTPLGH